MISQCKQHRRHRKAHSGHHFFQQRFQHIGQQHGRTQKGQYAKNDPFSRHEHQRHRRYQRSGGKHGNTAPQHMPPKGRTEAGQQNEHPADGLLPQTARRTGIPPHIHVKQKHQIPAGMVQHHADQIQPAQLVQQGVAARRGLLPGGVSVFHSPVSPFAVHLTRDKL